MPLSAWDKLGPYEILSPLGAGGMGEVYKARDTRLDRSVALKVLPEHIAKREDLRARFEREARAVASLNHPHICVLHDIGIQDGARYMVMELLEGETFAARIEKGAIPLEQTVVLATQIADALDRAHRAGVAHRDVKPANIMLTRDGAKVLDFGLAKSSATKPAPAEKTLTMALTSEGTVMGTPQYMAPEQFAGKEADARSDIWAFGAVLYEMVTGRKAFQAKSYTSLVGAILTAEPAPMSVKPFTPAWLERLVRRCLEKDPEDRWQSMRDIVLELRSPAAESAAPAKGSRWPWVAATAVATMIAVAVSLIHFREKPPEQPVLITSILPPDKAAFNEFAISPDGRLLAFTATSEGTRQLWVRPLDAKAAQPLAGTEEAAHPFWSPDSSWIGFFAQGKLKKIKAGGGPRQTLCEASQGGGTWNQEGLILYSGLSQGLWRVAAQGGLPAQITARDRAKSENRYYFPVFLPGGRRYVYFVGGIREDTAGIYLGTLNSKERTRLVGDQASPGYAEGPAGEGYLLFVREGTLMAQRLDAEKGALSGEAFPVAQGMTTGVGGRRAPFSVSGNGMLVYESGSGETHKLRWMDREGRRLDAVEVPVSGLHTPALSPDQKQVAFVGPGGEGQLPDIWVRDLTTGISTRFTFDPQVDFNPVWSPDGSRIVFSSDREGSDALYVKSASGAGQEELLLNTGKPTFASDWAAGAGLLLYYENDPKTQNDLWVLPAEGERKPAPFLRTEFNERNGAFSPDGNWIAYASDESRRYEVYVQPYPRTGAKWQVSKDGGRQPKWRRDGRELYWLDEDGTLMAAAVSAKPLFRSGIPQPLFRTGIASRSERYAASGDGKRFLVPMTEEDGGSRPLTVVQNWLAAAKR